MKKYDNDNGLDLINTYIICKVAGIIIAFIIVIILMLCGIDVKADEEYPTWYRVTSSTLNVRLGPGAEYDVFYTLSRGEEVPGKTKDGAWTEVNCYGFRGFVYSAYISDKKNPAAAAVPQGGNMTYIGDLWITGYDGCGDCSPNGITASQTRPVVGRTVAMSGYAFGTNVYIEGIGYRVVEDRGVGPGVVDVYCSNHAECYAITGRRKVYIVR